MVLHASIRLVQLVRRVMVLVLVTVIQLVLVQELALLTRIWDCSGYELVVIDPVKSLNLVDFEPDIRWE